MNATEKLVKVDLAAPIAYPDATVFVVDDDDAVRKGLTRLIRATGWRTESFSSANDFLVRDAFSGIGCVLVDLQMPEVNGIQLQAMMAQAGIILPVIFLTAKGDIETSVLAMKKGAVDFLIKPVDSNQLIPAIEQALARHKSEMSSKAVRDEVLKTYSLLSEREREVLSLVLQGLLNKQIAFQLGIAEKTVKVHRGRVMEKMNARTVADLVHKCDCVGIFQSNSSRH